MTTAIGIVITDHIVAGRLEDKRLTGKPLRFPFDPAERTRSPPFPPANSSRCSPGQIAFLPERRPPAP